MYILIRIINMKIIIKEINIWKEYEQMGVLCMVEGAGFSPFNGSDPSAATLFIPSDHHYF